MPQFTVKSPSGNVYTINGPEGSTLEQAKARAMQMEQSRAQTQQGGVLRQFGTGINNFVRGAADTLTLGTSDELSAGLGAATGVGGKFGDYAGNVARQREQDRQGGLARTAGQVAGAFLLPTGAISGAKGIAGLLGAAAEGAGYGALYGAGAAEGGIGERAKGGAKGAALGAAGGVAGRTVGQAGARILRGRQVPAAVRTLANEGVVMTPGRRGGAVKRFYEEAVLGSVPFVKSIPAQANRRSVEQFNVAAYNRVLKPLGQKLPITTKPGREAVGALQDTVYGAFDAATAPLNLSLDAGINHGVVALRNNATASVGVHAPQLNSIIDNTLAPLQQGRLSGAQVSGLLGDLRGEASGWMTSAVKSERNVGEELWKLHDTIETGLLRQNSAAVLAPFKKAREAVSLLKRVEAAAAANKADGIFNPQQFATAVSKRGYGTTTGKVAAGKAPMQDLADAAKQVLPATVPNSGTPERAVALSTVLGGGIGYVNPLAGAAAGASLASYAPGVGRLMQYLALNRPDLLVRGGNALDLASPYLGTAGALGAASQGQ